MAEELNLKRIFFFTLMGAIMFSGVYLFVDTESVKKENKFEKFLSEFNQKQNIAPKRLYVNAWRKIRNEYYDISMNNQNWYRWRYRYLNQIVTPDDADVAINTMLASLNDQPSVFLRTEQYKKQKVVMDAHITGIGANLKQQKNGIVVDNIIKNSPADIKELEIGDFLLKINDVDIEKYDLTSLSNITSDKSKKTIKLRIKRNGKLIDKEINISDINIKNMEYYISDDNIAYVRIENFMGTDAVKDFGNILQKTNGAKALILDLRNNYGGILTNAINMADLMISNELIVSLESRGNYFFRIFAKPYTTFENKPVVILTNNSTASSAEILAGTLRDNLGAIIVGEQTYGKNTIQKVIPLQNMTGLLLTTGKYILPKGEDIYQIGLTPDIVISNTSKNNDTQLEIAFETVDVMLNSPERLSEFVSFFNINKANSITGKKSKLRNFYRIKKTKLI